MLRDRAGLIDRLRSSRLDPRSVDQALAAAAEVASEIEHATSPATQSILGDIIKRVEIGSDAVTVRVDCQCLVSKITNGDPAAVEGSLANGAFFQLRKSRSSSSVGARS